MNRRLVNQKKKFSTDNANPGSVQKKIPNLNEVNEAQ